MDRGGVPNSRPRPKAEPPEFVLTRSSSVSTSALIYIHVIGCIALFALGYYMGSRKRQ